MGSPSDTGYAALLREVIVAPCLCGRAHIVQPEGVQSTVYFAWRNYISERAPAADTGSSASEHVKVIGKSGCTLLPGELSRSMKQGTTLTASMRLSRATARLRDAASRASSTFCTCDRTVLAFVFVILRCHAAKPSSARPKTHRQRRPHTSTQRQRTKHGSVASSHVCISSTCQNTHTWQRLR